MPKALAMRLLLLFVTLASINCRIGTCKLSKDPGSNLTIHGTVVFIQNDADNTTKISYSIQGLNPKAKHGIHVHKWGLIEGGCVNTGDHYNPNSKTHGSLTSWTRHIGDMGNLIADQSGKSVGSVSAWDIGLYGQTSVIGRGLVVVVKYQRSMQERTIWDQEHSPSPKPMAILEVGQPVAQSGIRVEDRISGCVIESLEWV